MVENDKKKEPKKPILVVQYIGKKKYPRVEVFMDGTGAALHVRDKNGDKDIKGHTYYCANKIGNILSLTSNIILIEKLTKHLPEGYTSTLEELMAIVKEHHKFMENLAGEIDYGDN